MKRVIILFVVLCMVLIHGNLYGQVWKPYADSAKAFFEQKKPDQAIVYFKKAKQELTADSAVTQSYGRMCYNLGYVYQSMNEFEKAESQYMEARKTWETAPGIDHPNYSTSCNSLAILYINMGRMEKAEPLFLEVKQIRERMLGKDHPDYLSICNNLANVYCEMGKFEKAEPLYLETKQSREKLLGKEHPDYASSCNNLANFYKAIANFEKAEPLYLEAIQIRGKVLGKEDPDYASTCNNLAVLYYQKGLYDKAEPLYLESKQIDEKVYGKDQPQYAGDCNNLAALYDATGKHDKAELLYLEAGDIIIKIFGRMHPSYAQNRDNLGNLYLVTGKYEKAETHFLEGIEIREKILGRRHHDFAFSCNNLGGFYQELGRYKQAEPYFIEARDIMESVVGNKHPDYARICNNLGLLYQDMGEFEKAESLLLEAKEIKGKVIGKESADYSGTITNLASLYQELGQYEKAELLYSEAKKIREKTLGKHHETYAASCNNLATIYREIGMYEKAEPLFLEAQLVYAAALGKDHPDYATGCVNLANLYSDIGQNKKAEPLYIEARTIWGRVYGLDHPVYSKGCSNLGIFYLDIGDYKKAESLFIETLSIREKALGKEHPDYSYTINKLADLYWCVGQYPKAESYYLQTMQLKQARIRKIFQFTSETEKQSYLQDAVNQSENYLSYTTTNNAGSFLGNTYDFTLSNRQLILNSSRHLRNTVFNSTDTSVRNKYDRWISDREQISFWYAKPVANRPEFLKDLEEKANVLEKELTRLSADFSREKSGMEITWKDIQGSLKQGEAAIEFAEFNFFDSKRWTDSVYYIALVLRKDKPGPELVKLFEKKQLDSVLGYKKTSPGQHKINDLYSAQEKNIFTKPGLNLYDVIWQPLESKLAGISTIYFAPAGTLHKISFAALPVSKTEVLGDKYQLIRLNTTATIMDYATSAVMSKDKILLYGGIQYDADSAKLKNAVMQYGNNDVAVRSIPEDLLREGVSEFGYLPGTESEVVKINSLALQMGFTANTIKGINATEESFKAISGKGSPAVLHIATHGFFFPDPKDSRKDDRQGGSVVFRQSDNPLIRSGLAVAGANNAWKGTPVKGVEDGILTSYEISNMYLPNTKLAVLSACETGLGDIQGSEGVYGLQRAFKMAGVQNLVMSLWRVDDNAASEFMLEFYKNLFARQKISEAFYHAQAAMKKKYRNDPYRWAAWILVR